MRSVVAFGVVLSAIVALVTRESWDTRLDPTAVKAACRAFRDAARVERRAGRGFEDAAAASRRGGWDQTLALVGEDPSWRVAERERWSRLSAELMAASRKRSDTTDLAQNAARALSEMRAEAVRREDDASRAALDRCKGAVDRYAKVLRAS